MRRCSSPRFQTAWFFGCLLLLLALLHPAVCGLAATRALAAEMLTVRRPLIVGAACGFAAGIVPFLLLYVPVFLAGHSRDFAEVASNMPEWRDLANVTAENAVWGGFLYRLGIADASNRPAWEVELAFTPAVMVVFVAGVVVLAARSRRHPDGADRVFVMLGAAVVVLWLLQMDYLGVRPWRAVWAVVPGAKAVRYTFRSQLVANLLVALVVARVLAGMARLRGVDAAGVRLPAHRAGQPRVAADHVAPGGVCLDRCGAAATRRLPRLLRGAERRPARPPGSAAPGRRDVVRGDPRHSDHQRLFELVSGRLGARRPGKPRLCGRRARLG